MPLGSRPLSTWRLRRRNLPLGERTLVMAILNLTPDSFSGDGLSSRALPAIVRAALSRLDEGADILDLGAESTRPGAVPVADAVEVRRLMPVLEAVLRERPDALISVDTYHAATAKAALAAGAEIVNDVSGLMWDMKMAEVVARAKAGVVLMHTRGTPADWHLQDPLADAEVLPMVSSGLRERLQRAAEAGMAAEQTVLDPGYGFGKRKDENFVLLAGQHELLKLGRPLLAGLSRKSFLGKLVAHLHPESLPAPLTRLNAGIAANVAAMLGGASILRVHDVTAAQEAAALVDAVLAAGRAVGPPTGS